MRLWHARRVGYDRRVAENEPGRNFGFLDTDEVLERPSRRSASFDRTIGGGCFAFTAASLAQFAALALPFVASDRLSTYDHLYRTAAIGAALALVAGFLFTHFARLAGLAGSISGLLPAGVFVYLYLWHEITQAPAIEGYVPPEFPATVAWAVPLSVACSSGLLWVGYYWVLCRMEPMNGRQT